LFLKTIGVPKSDKVFIEKQQNTLSRGAATVATNAFNLLQDVSIYKSKFKMLPTWLTSEEREDEWKSDEQGYENVFSQFQSPPNDQNT